LGTGILRRTGTKNETLMIMQEAVRRSTFLSKVDKTRMLDAIERGKQKESRDGRTANTFTN